MCTIFTRRLVYLHKPLERPNHRNYLNKISTIALIRSRSRLHVTCCYCVATPWWRRDYIYRIPGIQYTIEKIPWGL
ncbi:hypothetical protein RSAG8_08737, partial [Rhizoctonia solani AG-8 WAC10335]